MNIGIMRVWGRNRRYREHNYSSYGRREGYGRDGYGREGYIDISGSMDIRSNPAKNIGNAEAIKLSIFSEYFPLEF